MLERLGLLEQPPHCQVSVSASEGERLLAVTVDDVRRIQLPWGAASALGGPAQQHVQAQQQSSAPAGAAAQPASGAEQQQQQDATSHAAETDVTASLQLENAKLRAELASAIALDCIRSAQLASAPSLGAASAQASQRAAASGSGSGQASPHPAASAASSPRAPSAGIAAVAAPAAPAVPAEAAHRFERALAAKDSLAAELQAQLSASRQQAAAYEARIQHLESQLAALAAAADGRTPAGALRSLAAPAEAGAASSAASRPDAASSAPASVSRGGSDGSTFAADAVALPAAPSSKQQQHAGLELSASVDAAGGSSLAGNLRAPDVSRSLGPSTSLPTTSQCQQQQQQEQQQQQQQALQQDRAKAVEEAGTEQAGTTPVPVPAAPADQGQLAAATPSADPVATAGIRQECGTALATPTAITADVGEAGSTASPAGNEDLAAAGSQDGTTLSTAQVQQPLPEGTQAAAPAAVPAPEPAMPAEQAAQAAEPGPEAGASPPPHPLLSSLMAGEGSDVEGVEPLSGSESGSEAGEGAAGFGSPSGGYGSARSGSPHSKAGDDASTSHTPEAAAPAAVAAAEETEKENAEQPA